MWHTEREGVLCVIKIIQCRASVKFSYEKMHCFSKHVCEYNKKRCYIHKYMWQEKKSIIYSKICTLQLRRNSAELSDFPLSTPQNKVIHQSFPWCISFMQNSLDFFLQNSFRNKQQKVKCFRYYQLACFVCLFVCFI